MLGAPVCCSLVERRALAAAWRLQWACREAGRQQGLGAGLGVDVLCCSEPRRLLRASAAPPHPPARPCPRRWVPNTPTLVHVIPRAGREADAAGRPLRVHNFTAPPLFIFHNANAFQSEDGGQITVDSIHYDSLPAVGREALAEQQVGGGGWDGWMDGWAGWHVGAAAARATTVGLGLAAGSYCAASASTCWAPSAPYPRPLSTTPTTIHPFFAGRPRRRLPLPPAPRRPRPEPGHGPHLHRVGRLP